MQNGLVLALISLALVTQAKGAEPVPHLNSVSAFLGVTSEGRRQRASTLGLEYERRLSEEWFITPAQQDHVDGAGTQREFLFRTGVLYELEVGDLIVAPHAMVDFVADEKVAVVGVTVGINF